MSITDQETKSFTEYDAVVAALTPYIETAKSGEADKMRPTFYDHAHVVGSMNGDFLNMTIEQFKDALNGFGPSADIKHHIAWIDISGPAAAAKVEFINWLGFRFTDFFILYKHEGTWKISGKVYDSHAKN